MQNIVGQIPRGEDFFPRPEIIQKIYRRLETGANIYIAAPRRAGKTAIMRHLEDQPRANYEFQYLLTESVDHPITFFKMLIDSFKEFTSLSQKSVKAIGDFLNRFSKVEGGGSKSRWDKKRKRPKWGILTNSKNCSAPSKRKANSAL